MWISWMPRGWPSDMLLRSYPPVLCCRSFHGLCVSRSSFPRRPSFFLPLSASSDNSQSNPPVDFDLLDDMLGSPKDAFSSQVTSNLRTRYVEDGESFSSFPCPDCRGRGYIVCSQCEVTLDSSCIECSGKGLTTCLRCMGKRALPVQAVYETLWDDEKLRGPLLPIDDDDIIDNMDIQLPPRASKRIYSSPSVDVREKIRRALKALDARTGSVTRRMRRIHNDPILNAKRIAAIKKAKSTEASRRNVSEKLRLYFQDPSNRLKRSLSLKGAVYHCSNCGEEGHRRHYCPTLAVPYKVKRSYHCSTCGEAGHKRTKCHQILRSSKDDAITTIKKRDYRCGVCKKLGHNARTCKDRKQ